MSSKDQTPLVAISCITYNHEAYIRDALEGFVSQKTNFPFVAIVHDDASSDGTASIIREYAEKYPDIIKPIFETENQYSKKDGTLTKIMKEACLNTGAKYIAMCEGDDYWTDSLKLQKQYDALEAHPECTISLNRVMKVDPLRESLNLTIPPANHIKSGIVTLQDLINEEFYGGNWTFQTCCFFFRSSIYNQYIQNINTIFKKFPYGDMPLLLTCLLAGNGIFFTEIMGCYTVLSGGYNSNMEANRILASYNSLKVSEAIKDFNNYTKYKFDKQLQHAILRYQFNAEVSLDKKFNFKLFLPRYRRFYKTALLKLLESLFPVIYCKLRQHRKRINYK